MATPAQHKQTDKTQAAASSRSAGSLVNINRLSLNNHCTLYLRVLFSCLFPCSLWHPFSIAAANLANVPRIETNPNIPNKALLGIHMIKRQVHSNESHTFRIIPRLHQPFQTILKLKGIVGGKKMHQLNIILKEDYRKFTAQEQ